MTPPAEPAAPSTLDCVRRGLIGRCPACGGGRIFPRFLKVADACPACGTALHHHRADDFPPYIVIFIVGHLLGYGIYLTESQIENVPFWVHLGLWPALTIILCLALLQPAKGAVVGLQYGLGMHGFDEQRRDPSGAGDHGFAASARQKPVRPV